MADVWRRHVSPVSCQPLSIIVVGNLRSSSFTQTDIVVRNLRCSSFTPTDIVVRNMRNSSFTPTGIVVRNLRSSFTPTDIANGGVLGFKGECIGRFGLAALIISIAVYRKALMLLALEPAVESALIFPF